MLLIEIEIELFVRRKQIGRLPVCEYYSFDDNDTQDIISRLTHSKSGCVVPDLWFVNANKKHNKSILPYANYKSFQEKNIADEQQPGWLLLRWGSATFLNMLIAYYGVKNRKRCVISVRLDTIKMCFDDNYVS